MTDALFVYGSLRSEFDNPHARLLRERADLAGRATVRGSVFLVGEYPAYRQEPDGVVHGEVWWLSDPEATFAVLDDYEGSEYTRIAVPASDSDVRAWIYLYKGEVSEEARIQSGDFLVR